MPYVCHSTSGILTQKIKNSKSNDHIEFLQLMQVMILQYQHQNAKENIKALMKRLAPWS